MASAGNLITGAVCVNTLPPRSSTKWGVTFTPWHDPDGRVGFHANRDGLTNLVYLTLPADPGHGRPLSVDVCSRPDTAGEHDPDDATATVRLDIIGPATAHPWTDGFSVGWRVEGLHHTRYVYLTPSVDGEQDDDVADVHVYVSDSDDPTDAGTVLWLPVHDRTAEPLIAAGPVTGPGVAFDPAEFADWFRTADTQQALAGLVTARYDSGDPDDSAAFRAHALLSDGLPATVWRLAAGMSAVAIWPTTDPEGSPAGDGGAVLTFRFGGVELSAGHLAVDELIRRVYIAGNGTVRATALHAAIQVLTAVAARVNDTVRHFAQVMDQTGGDATRPGVATTAAAPSSRTIADQMLDLVGQYAQAHTTAAIFGAAEDHARAAQLLAEIRSTIRPTIAAPDDDAPDGVPVSLVTGWTTTTIHVDPDLEDAVVFVTVGDPAGDPVDIVGIDFNAGTVGVWTGSDPDNHEWTVVHHLDADQIRDQARPPTTTGATGDPAAQDAAPR